MSARDMAKRTAAGTLALAVCIGGAALTFAEAAHGAPAPAIAPADFDKRSAVVASGDSAHLVDSVTAGPFAATLGASILLVPGDRMDANTYGYVSNAHIQVVYIVGGTSAVSPAVEQVICNWGVKVYRFAGADRYETARLIAEANDQAYA